VGARSAGIITPCMKYAKALPDDAMIVSCQAARVSDVVNRSTILSRKFMPLPRRKKALELGRSLGFTTLAYTVEGVVTDCRPGKATIGSEMKGLHRPRRPTSRVLENPDLPRTGHVQGGYWMGGGGGKNAEITRLGLSLPTISPRPSPSQPTPRRAFWNHDSYGEPKERVGNYLATHLGIPSADAWWLFGDGDNDTRCSPGPALSGDAEHGWPAGLRSAKHVAPRLTKPHSPAAVIWSCQPHLQLLLRCDGLRCAAGLSITSKKSRHDPRSHTTANRSSALVPVRMQNQLSSVGLQQKFPQLEIPPWPDRRQFADAECVPRARCSSRLHSVAMLPPVAAVKMGWPRASRQNPLPR